MKIQRRRLSTIVSNEIWSTPKLKFSKPRRETCYLNWFIKTKMFRTKAREVASTWLAPTVVSTYSKGIHLSLAPWSDKANNRRATTQWTSSSSSNRNPANQARRLYLVEKFSWSIRGIKLCSRNKTVSGRTMFPRCSRCSSRKQLVLSYSSNPKRREIEHHLVRCKLIKVNSKSITAIHRTLNRWECLNIQFRCSHNRSKTVEAIPREEMVTCFL